MKRFHVHLHVEDLARNIAFYSAMFKQTPARTEDDYAKWMLQDPPVNFAISTRGDKPGLDHLGFQVESTEELQALKTQAEQADMALLDEGETTCCYARSDKYWVTDPQGIAWEQFHTLDNIPVFSQKNQAAPQAGACCAPKKVIEVASAGCCAPTSAQVANGAKACC
ncbi:ArsI/CadI family heavy metal resistance metalloenzyme [Rhodoferax sp. BAB1]|uniref:ArsI/CadI family heavy metal resistance metalloenzyme n=1 Tax=Rhodoferax sp. BAB1 TaxID=2741720 RepID=UPI001575160B|nr:ArsI/CadI family heavy metal resistance metalloenzyme [Rhodoferax sp. BAB1]QKO21435.1 VOC family protein [Rhodoferax sp. BAB1]